MMHSWRKTLFVLACGAFAATPAFAQSDAQGDPVAGRAKYNGCVGCHGIPGYNNVYPTYHVPKLGGQHAEAIVAALQAYRTGARQHPTMNAQASSLTEQDIQDIAAFLSQPGPQ